MSAMPEHIADAVEVLRAAGWVEPANGLDGRCLLELLTLTQSGEVGMIQLGPWQEDGIPRVVNLMQLAQVEAAPRRPPLRAVGG